MNDRIHRCPSSRSVLPCQTIAFVNPGISTGGSLTTSVSSAGVSRSGATAIRSQVLSNSGSMRKLGTETETLRRRLIFDSASSVTAWLIENLEGGRVRILTQETQIGKPAQELAQAQPNPMINGHQNWLNGLVDAAKGLSF